MYSILYSAFRTNMHGAICLFSKYFKHLTETEDLKELDISSSSSSDNIFRDKTTLSTGWTGTCINLILINLAQIGIEDVFASLSSIITSDHQKTINTYDGTSNLIDNLFIVNNITVAHPSGSTKTLTPSFEIEFSDKNNVALIGGEIYYDLIYELKPFIDELKENIIKEINSLINNSTFKSNIDTAVSNFANFDETAATASNVMNKKIFDLKQYFLTSQFLLMLFTWFYLFFFIILAIIYIIYALKGYDLLYYVILVIVNILFVLILLEIFLSSFFGQIRLICHEAPRAMNFIFTGTYIVSGNSESYPAQFGKKDENMTKMFTTCLNGDGDLYNLFIPSDYLNPLISLQNNINNLYNNVSNIIDKSNIITKDYFSIENSIFLKAIIQFKLMHDNLYLASEGFGDDDIYTIISNIRKNLDSENCSMTYEYYVVRESDCPPGSIKLKEIYETPGVYHCYIIQNLNMGSIASYKASGCDNIYINKAINFIQEVDSMLELRIYLLESLQKQYSETYKDLYNEIQAISKSLDNSFYQINGYLKSVKNYSNCGSTRFDLIDFADFIGDTTEYDARIIVIFSAFLGVFGFVLLYSFLLIINSITEEDNNDDDDYDEDDGIYNKVKNSNRKMNKSNFKKKATKYNDEDEDEDEEEEDEDKNYKKKINKKTKVQPKTEKKIEMSILSKNSDDSDSS